jgi:transposase
METGSNVENNNYEAETKLEELNRLDLSTRTRIINFFLAGKSKKSIYEYEKLPKSTVLNVIKRYNETNAIESSPRGGGRIHKLTEDIRYYVKEIVDEDCTLSLKKISSRVLNEKGISISHSSVQNCLNDLHNSLKLLHPIPARRNEEDVINIRQNYAISFLNIEESTPPSKKIFIDEGV